MSPLAIKVSCYVLIREGTFKLSTVLSVEKEKNKQWQKEAKSRRRQGEGRNGTTVSETVRVNEDAITQTEPKIFDNVYKKLSRESDKNSLAFQPAPAVS